MVGTREMCDWVTDDARKPQLLYVDTEASVGYSAKLASCPGYATKQLSDVFG